MNQNKPLNGKAYGSIPHLPGSRMGPADHHCTEGMAKIATEKPRDKHDVIICQEKLDGSCCSVAKINGVIVPLTRAGYHALTSPYEQHHLFAGWVRKYEQRFFSLLDEGERVVGEWLAQAHGTRYELRGREPFVAFDLFGVNNKRMVYAEFSERTNETLYTPATIIKHGASISLQQAEVIMNIYGHYGAVDPIEGFVWRVERKGVVDFLVKYVRPDKEDGHYLSQISGKPDVWNWKP